MATRSSEARPTAVNWAVEVAVRTKGANFPLDKQQAQDLLKGVQVEGKDISRCLDQITFPVSTPADLLHEISQVTGRHKGTPGRNWAVEVAQASRNVNFPLSKDEAMSKFSGIDVRGKDIGQVLERVEFPVDTPADLLHKIAMHEYE